MSGLLRAAHLALLDLNQKLVISEIDAVDETDFPLEKTSGENVGGGKSQKGPAGNAAGERLQRFISHGRIAREDLFPAHRCLETHGGFLRGVAIVALEPIRPTFAQAVMQIGLAHVIETTVDFSFLLPVAEIDEIRAAAPEEAKLPFRKGIASFEPPAFDDQFPAAIKSRGRIGSVFDRLQNRLLKFRRARFIGIEKKDPGMADAAILDRPIPLGGEAGERMIVAVKARTPRDIYRGVATAGINEVNILAPADRFEQTRQIALFVLRENDDGNAHPRDGSTRPEDAARISSRHAIVGNVFRYDRASAYETARAHPHARHDESARTDEGIVSDGDFRGD
jgi:hypothetical protein